MRRYASGFHTFAVISLATAGILTGCSPISLSRAPVESRESQRSTPPVPHRSDTRPVIVDSHGKVISSGQGSGAAQSHPVPPRSGAGTAHRSPFPPGSTSAVTAPGATATVADNRAMAGQPGYHTVRAGDNIYRIGLNNSQRWQDIAAWNNLQEPYTISIGQVLRVAPLPGEAVAVTPVVDEAEATTPAAAPEVSGSRTWVWPARGRLLNRYNGSTHKGINIAGKRGDAVMAARAGTVAYAGDGLRGYGKLIIIKHDATYLTAYAHNDKLLVKENQQVAQGQQIAEMGKTHTSRVMLHFEVRKDGKPVDPMQYLKQ